MAIAEWPTRDGPADYALFIGTTCIGLVTSEMIEELVHRLTRYCWWKVNDLEQGEGYNGLQLRALSEHLQHPDFWKGTRDGAQVEDVNCFQLYRLIDYLGDGKDAENFFAAL